MFGPRSGEFKGEISGSACPRSSDGDICSLAPSLSLSSTVSDSPPSANKAARNLGFTFNFTLFQRMSLDQTESGAQLGASFYGEGHGFL